MTDCECVNCTVRLGEVASLREQLGNAKAEANHHRGLKEHYREQLAQAQKERDIALRWEKKNAHECNVALSKLTTAKERAEEAEDRVRRLREALRRLLNQADIEHGYEHPRGCLICDCLNEAEAILAETKEGK